MTDQNRLSAGHADKIVVATGTNSALRKNLDDAKNQGLPLPCGAVIRLSPIYAGLIRQADGCHDLGDPHGGGFFRRLRRRFIAAFNRISS